MTMRERIARAMCDGDWNAKDFKETPSGETPEELRAYWFDKADAVLAAIREPTEAMASAGSEAAPNFDSYELPDDIPRIWQAMIDAAISEGNTTQEATRSWTRSDVWQAMIDDASEGKT